MRLRLPDLDDLRWEDLVEEGRSLIPATAPEWTNHNVSDPGITLIELLAYISERLMYQLNRVPDEHTLRFLKLVQGQDFKWKSRQHLQEARAVVSVLHQTTRAVTNEDFEHLARQVPGVSRAVCIARRNLESNDAAIRESEASGHVTVVVIQGRSGLPSRELLYQVKQALEPARLLTTRVHVIAPHYLRVGFRLTIVPKPGAAEDAVKKNVIMRIRNFFDPLTGWIAGKGWPLGRAIHVSELYQVLGDLNDVELVTASKDINGERMNELVLEPPETDRLRRNEYGDVESVELRTGELVDASIDPGDLVIAAHA